MLLVPPCLPHTLSVQWSASVGRHERFCCVSGHRGRNFGQGQRGQVKIETEGVEWNLFILFFIQKNEYSDLIISLTNICCFIVRDITTSKEVLEQDLFLDFRLADQRRGRDSLNVMRLFSCEAKVTTVIRLPVLSCPRAGSPFSVHYTRNRDSWQPGSPSHFKKKMK